jgi:hypothetical protein
VRNLLATDNLPSQIKKSVVNDDFSAEAGIALARLDTEKEQEKASKIVKENKLTRDETRTFAYVIKTAPEPLNEHFTHVSETSR